MAKVSDTTLPGLQNIQDFPLVQALFGRRSRRFAVGATIPDGPLAYSSKQEPIPLSEQEKLLILTAMAGTTGWHNLIPYNFKYVPDLPNYSGAAGGRTFPSAAGFEVSDIFFTDDTGTYFFPTKDAPAQVERDSDGQVDLNDLVAMSRARIRKIRDGRMNLPPEEPHVESHNTWITNCSGSLFAIPVGDLAQHMILNLFYYLQNGYVIFDDINREQIPGIERFKEIADVENPLPLSFIELWSFGECNTELVTSAYAGALMLQAMGLGGWMYNGVNPFSVLGAMDPEIGLGFQYNEDEHWPWPNPTGLPGVFEAFCPPNYPDMRSAVEAVVKRKFGAGGPFNPDTPGPWKDTPKVRGSARKYSEEFIDCVALMAQYIYDRFGKFPGTMPSVLAFIYLQAFHLDLEFYDKFYKPGAYLQTHAEHMKNWHGGS